MKTPSHSPRLITKPRLTAAALLLLPLLLLLPGCVTRYKDTPQYKAEMADLNSKMNDCKLGDPMFSFYMQEMRNLEERGEEPANPADQPEADTEEFVGWAIVTASSIPAPKPNVKIEPPKPKPDIKTKVPKHNVPRTHPSGSGTPAPTHQHYSAPIVSPP